MPKPPVILLAFANDREGKYLRNISAEQELIRQALKQVQKEKFCELVFINYATIDSILQAFREHKGRIKVFHYAGHGEDYALLLNSTTKEKLHADGFAQFLGQQPGLELVFLNGCITATHQQALKAAGIRHLVLTSTLIQDEVARDFARGFYQSLSHGSDVEVCFKEASGQVIARKGKDPRGFVIERMDSDELPWKLISHPEETTPWKLTVRRISVWVYTLIIVAFTLLSAWGWIQFRPEAEPFDFMLIIQDEAENPLATLEEGDELIISENHSLLTDLVEKAKLGILIDGIPKWGEVDSKGNVNIKGIDHHYHKSSVSLILESRFWELLEGDRSISLRGKNTPVRFKRKPLLCSLKGTIELPNEKPLAKATLEIHDLPDATQLLATAVTQSDGSFSISIDPLRCKRQYVLDISYPQSPYTIRDTIYPENGNYFKRISQINQP